MKELGFISFLLLCFGIVGHYEWEDEQRVAAISADLLTLRCVTRNAVQSQSAERPMRLVSQSQPTTDAVLLQCRVLQGRS